MSSPFGRLHVMLNPRAGRGAMAAGWKDVERLLDELGLERTVVVTERPGHATEATRRALEEGATFVVAVGGDGTVHEVVNGMMGEAEPVNPDAVLGVIPAGSGCDFVRTFGLPQEPLAAARHLAGDGLWGRLDVAHVTCVGFGGERHARWFANVGEAGFGAAVVARAARLPRWLGGNVYRIAAMREVLGMKPARARISMHGRKARGARPDAPLDAVTYEGPVNLVVVANCQFFGGGMKVAPRAIPEDGLLDVLVGAAGSRPEALAMMQKMLSGEHVPSATVSEFLADRVELASDPPILVEVDGEVIGRTPAGFSLVHGAISLKI